MGELQRRYHTTATGEVIESLFLPDVGRQRGGTLMSEPVVAARGKHLNGFELFDQEMGQLGSAAVLGLGTFEFRDACDRCVFKLKEDTSNPDLARRIGLAGSAGRQGKWRYEVVAADGSETISVRRVGRWTPTATICNGPRQIGLMRPGSSSRIAHVLEATGFKAPKRSPALVIEDEPGHEVAWVHIGRTSSGDDLVELVVEIEDRTSEQLRKVALAASVIADYELISFSSGGG